LLAAHLDPNTDAASRQPETVDASVAWIVKDLRLVSGAAILDLGCGPGLYSRRLARLGMQVTGLDISRESIAFAQRDAIAEKLTIEYQVQNYLQLSERERFDVALLIHGDYCVLSPADRKRLLHNTWKALKAGGKFVLDVTTCECGRKAGLKQGWHAAQTGFWSDRPHIVLEQGYDYPELGVHLDQYIVVEDTQDVRVFRNWFQDFTESTITDELEASGFEVLGIYADLLGNPCTGDSGWLGAVAMKPPCRRA
jgi:SAM-dependent methyltransferase